MKRILKTSLITTVIMVAVLTTVFVTLSKKQANKEVTSELDLVSETKEKEDFDEGASKKLHIGKEGEILSLGKKEISDIYSKKKSKKIEDKIERLKKVRRYTFEKPLLIWNPYGTNELSMYYSYKDDESTYIKYTIQVDDTDIPDFTRVLSTHTEGNTTRNHEYLITGFVPGYQNKLIVRRYHANGKLASRVYFQFFVDKLKEPVKTKLTYRETRNTSVLSNGLFAVCGYHAGDAKAPAVIPFYDNSGILRSVIPLANYRTDRIEFVNGNMIYSYSNKNFAEVAPIGKVVKTYSLENYRLNNDFTYNGYGQLWCLASDINDKSTEKDCVVSIDMDNGKVKKLVDFKTLLSGMRRDAAKADTTRPLNWIDLNSIVRVDSSDIIVSSRELSTIIRVNSVTSEYPRIGYLIGDSAIWKHTKYKKYLLTKGAYVKGKWYNLVGDTEEGKEEGVEDFVCQFGQNSVDYKLGSKLGEQQYYLTMFNNNYGYAKTLPDVEWGSFAGIGRKGKAAEGSRFYEYIVDEKAGYYGLNRSFGVPYSSQGGSAYWNGTNTIVSSMDGKLFGEYDGNGRLIREFSLKAYRVYKYDLKNYWFD